MNTQPLQLAQSKIEKNVVDFVSLHSESQDYDANIFLMHLVTIILHLDNPPGWSPLVSPEASSDSLVKTELFSVL